VLGVRGEGGEYRSDVELRATIGAPNAVSMTMHGSSAQGVAWLSSVDRGMPLLVVLLVLPLRLAVSCACGIVICIHSGELLPGTARANKRGTSIVGCSSNPDSDWTAKTAL
jgi:hypothetical protein